MKEVMALQEKTVLLEQEIKTLTEKVGLLESRLREFGDIETELKGLKIFLGRIHPELMTQLPEIIQKVRD
ncbi:MAG: hypothetical protein HGA78_10105 [Nitrospirales bacterium]|nr:hypothetical protein [Nitrospirales bacterium]